MEVMASCFVNLLADIRGLRVRADAGFGFAPVFEILEDRNAQYEFPRMTYGSCYDASQRRGQIRNRQTCLIFCDKSGRPKEPLKNSPLHG